MQQYYGLWGRDAYQRTGIEQRCRYTLGMFGFMVADPFSCIVDEHERERERDQSMYRLDLARSKSYNLSIV